ncbi:helix-hairpin-helix domain-containing protein [Hydrogenimonas sp.]
MAEKIVAHRNEHGPFEKLEDLLKVKGLGKKKLEKIKEYLAIK